VSETGDAGLLRPRIDPPSQMKALDIQREWEFEREEALHRARNGLLSFTMHTKPDFELSWHHRVMCRALNALERGDILRLLITAPPRHTKSEFVSRRFPAYVLGRNPDCEVISASYGATLAQRMNRDVQRIITGPLYRELFPATRLNEKNIRTVSDGSWLRNSEMFEVVGRKGYYLCAGIGGGLVGSGGDVAIIDDPIKSWREAYSPTFRQTVWEWYASVLYTRLSKVGRICLTLTRWHENDLAGRLLEQARADPEADQWTHLHLPAINEAGPSQSDPRQIGEALWPDRFPLARLDKVRRNSERVFTANYQNRPSPEEGNLVKRDWWRLYRERPQETDLWCISMDGTFKDKEKSDFCVLQVWARRGADKFLIHQLRARMAYTAQKAAIRKLHKDYPQCTSIFLEDSALAQALKADLSSEISGIILVQAVGSKMMRAEAITPQIEGGNVYLPDPKMETWVESFILEWATFPNGANDDQVDATSLALTRLDDAFSYDWAPESIEKESAWLGTGF
jgi:predicted phage terminase large subunit-like protein